VASSKLTVAVSTTAALLQKLQPILLRSCIGARLWLFIAGEYGAVTVRPGGAGTTGTPEQAGSSVWLHYGCDRDLDAGGMRKNRMPIARVHAVAQCRGPQSASTVESNAVPSTCEQQCASKPAKPKLLYKMVVLVRL